MSVLVTALVCGFGVWLARYVLPLLTTKWAREAVIAEARNSVRGRYATIAEREVTLRERLAEKPNDRKPMPSDLEARINGWEDEFAREDERKFVEQLYAEHGDWDAVRRLYAPPLADNQPVAE